MATYPEDEFDQLPPTGRRGAHRREGDTGQRSAYAIIGVVAVIAILLVVAVFNIIRTSFVDPEEQVAEPPAAEQTESPGEDPTEDGDDSIAAVDKDAVTVAVFNGSGVTGAGAAFAEATEANGWNVDEVGNYQTPDSTSTVFYTSPDQEVQAAALADELGIEQIEESTDFSADLTVVIASDIAEQGPPAADGATEGPGGADDDAEGADG